MNIDNWKEFKINKLFNYERGKESAPNQNLIGDCILLTETSENNGFSRLVKPTKIIKGHCITVSVNYASTVFYQPKDFCASVNIIVLRPKIDMSENSLLFISSILSAKYRVFSYTDKISKSILMDDVIKLPEKNGKPDFNYMEEFIRNIKDKVIERYDNYRKDEIKKALESTGLTYEDLKGDLEVKSCDRYEKFKALDFFDDLSFQRDIANNEILDCGKTPVYSATTSNYGLLGFVNSEAKYNITEDNPYYIIFGDHTKKFNFVYNSFSTTDNCKVLIPKYGSKAFNLYILTVWDKMIPNLGYSRHWSKAKNLELTLPAIDEKNPDFAYMENVIYIY